MSVTRGMVITIVAPVILLAILVRDAILRPAWDAGRVFGFALTFVFLVLLTIARIQLGANFSVTPQARRLVTTGVYSKIRNPVYVFGTFVIVGGLLYIHRYVGLLILVVLVPVQVLRARAEARVLEARFGDQYRAYRAGTWF